MHRDNETIAIQIQEVLTRHGILVNLALSYGGALLGWDQSTARAANKEKCLVWLLEFLNDDFEDVIRTVESSIHVTGIATENQVSSPKRPIKVHVWAGISAM